jgi:flagellar basal-body rod modification protein FlgD
MSTGSVTSTGSTGAQSASSASSFNNLQPSDFMNMLITELQNQDPTNPMDTGQMLQQITQISTIESNDQLTSTLQGVLLGQNLAAGAGLLYQTVQGTDAAGNAVSGQVQSISVANGAVSLNVGTDSIPLANVSQVQPTGSSG